MVEIIYALFTGTLFSPTDFVFKARRQRNSDSFENPRHGLLAPV